MSTGMVFLTHHPPQVVDFSFLVGEKKAPSATAKQARGGLVRWICDEGVENIEGIKGWSCEDGWEFLREEDGGEKKGEAKRRLVFRKERTEGGKRKRGM